VLSDMEPSIRIGRYGPFLELERGEDRLRAPLPDDIAPADLTNELAVELLERRAEGPDELGEDEKTGDKIYLLDGRFGPYVQRGEAGDGVKPPRSSLPKGMSPESVTLDIALKLLSLPAELGPHPESGKPVKVGIGRYGPYVVHDGDYRSLKAGDDPLDITLERALQLLAEPKRGRGGAAATPLKELGPHPSDAGPVAIYDGRYGPYVKHGKTNASLPKGMEVDDLTMEGAVKLLEARLERDKAKKAKTGRKKK